MSRHSPQGRERWGSFRLMHEAECWKMDVGFHGVSRVLEYPPFSRKTQLGFQYVKDVSLVSRHWMPPWRSGARRSSKVLCSLILPPECTAVP